MKFKTNLYPSKEKPDSVRTVYEEVDKVSPRVYTTRGRYSPVPQIRTSADLHPNRFSPNSFDNTRAKTYHVTVNRRSIEQTSGDSYYVVQDPCVNRLDMIAHMYYNNATLWWVLADANPELRFNPLNVPRGYVVRIPNITTLYKYGGVMYGK